MTRRRALRAGIAALALAISGPLLAQARPASEAVFTRWDADRNGVLSRDEFEKGWAAQVRAARKAALDAAQARLHGQFEAIDGNDNDAIDAGEYANLVLVRRAGAAAPALASFDANRDGGLQFDEYLALVRSLAKAPGAGGGQ